jgi:predicted RND superfamily exporter protein
MKNESTGEAPGPRDFIGRLSSGFGALAGWSFDHRWWVVALSLALLGGSLALASRVEIDSSYEAYFDPNDPTFLYYDDYLEVFGSDEVSYILYSAPDVTHGPWDYEVMQRIVELTEALESEVPFVYEVNSLANAELMVGETDGISILKLSDDFPEDQTALLTLRDRYLDKPMFVGGMLSADAQHGAIIIEMDRTSTDPLEEIRLDPEGGDGLDNLYPQVTDAAIEEILARPEYAGIQFYHSGDVPMNAAYNLILTNESALLDGITAIVIAVVLALFFRSFVGMIAPVIVVQLSVISTVAFVVLIGWELDMSFGGTPTLLTAIGVAHSVHILSEFRARFAAMGDRRAALVETLQLVGTPCLLTSVTTAIGFGSMSFSPIKSLSHMGVYSAFGVLAAFALSLTLLLAFLSFGSPHPKPGRRGAVGATAKGGAFMQRLLGRTAELVVHHAGLVFAGFAVLFLFSMVGIAQIKVDSNWLNDFSDEMPLKQATIVVDEVMGGVTNLILLFDSGAPEAAKNPEVLAEIARVQDWANAQPLVRKSYSLVDILADLNQTFHEDDPEWHRVPDSRELVAQYLVLYEGAGGTEASQYVSSDYQVAALELRLALASTQQTAGLVRSLNAELAASPVEASTLRMTGIGALWLKLMDYIVSSQIYGFLIAFAVIGAILCLLFGSLRTGLVAMVPNLSPVLLCLGLMGWLEINLDYNKVMIAAVAMGIAVDDTIHLMLRTRFEFARTGNYPAAVRAATLDVGRALLITSVALVCGFLVLTLSVLDSQAMRGILLSITIAVALVADFLLLAAMVLIFKPFGPERAGVGAGVGDEAVREAA